MDKASVLRILVLIASLLGYFGVNVPETTLELAAGIVASVVGLYVAYKNNYLFSRGKQQKEVLEATRLYEKNK